MGDRTQYSLYAAKGDRGAHHLLILIMEAARNGLHRETCVAFSPRPMRTGLQCNDIEIEGFTIDPQELLDCAAWGLHDAVLLVETVAPKTAGEYQIRTYRPSFARPLEVTTRG